MTETRRRHLLKVLGTGMAAAVAGCIDGGEGDTDGDDGLFGDDGDDDQGDPGGDSGDGDDDAGGDDDGDGDAGDDDDSGLDEDVHPSDVLDESDLDGFVAEIDLGQIDATQTVYGRNAHLELDAGGVTTEHFEIDGDEYEVAPDGCQVRRDAASDLDLLFAVWLDPFRGFDPGDFSVIDRTTFDGEEVYVVEDPNETWKMYVSAETGYRVKEDMGEMDPEADNPTGGLGGEDDSIDFHSWNETSPIEPPDMDCEEV